MVARTIHRIGSLFALLMTGNVARQTVFLAFARVPFRTAQVGARTTDIALTCSRSLTVVNSHPFRAIGMALYVGSDCGRKKSGISLVYLKFPRLPAAVIENHVAGKERAEAVAASRRARAMWTGLPLPSLLTLQRSLYGAANILPLPRNRVNRRCSRDPCPTRLPPIYACACFDKESLSPLRKAGGRSRRVPTPRRDSFRARWIPVCAGMTSNGRSLLTSRA